MGENGAVLPRLRVLHHTTPMYMQLLSLWLLYVWLGRKNGLLRK